MTKSEMDALTFHAGWDDGRVGFVWCRFDGIVDVGRLLRAEITWGPCHEDGPEVIEEYVEPLLTLESNRVVREGSGERWETVEQVEIPMTDAEVVAILTEPPSRLLVKYADRFAKLAA